MFNAICEGSHAVMLSGESATGKYPVEAVSIMAQAAMAPTPPPPPPGTQPIKLCVLGRSVVRSS